MRSYIILASLVAAALVGNSLAALSLVPAPTTIQQDKSYCPPGTSVCDWAYETQGSSWIMVLRQPEGVTAFQADILCKRAGYRLASMHHADDLLYAQQHAISCTHPDTGTIVTPAFWIGLNCSSTTCAGSAAWVDGTPVDYQGWCVVPVRCMTPERG